MNIIDKIWGNTTELLSINNVSINRLNILTNTKCSRHYHKYKYNIFYVENGSIIVHTWINNEKKSILLKRGESLTIPPNREHQFECGGEDSIVYEIYYSITDAEDIVRIK